MKISRITLVLPLLLVLLGFSKFSYATNPISTEAFVEVSVDAKKETIVGKFFKKVKNEFKAMGKKIKTAYYAVARSAGSYLWLWIILGLVAIALGALAVGVAGGLGTFLSYASWASYLGSAVCFVLWIVALVG